MRGHTTIYYQDETLELSVPGPVTADDVFIRYKDAEGRDHLEPRGAVSFIVNFGTPVGTITIPPTAQVHYADHRMDKVVNLAEAPQLSGSWLLLRDVLSGKSFWISVAQILSGPGRGIIITSGNPV